MSDELRLPTVSVPPRVYRQAMMWEYPVTWYCREWFYDRKQLRRFETVYDLVPSPWWHTNRMIRERLDNLVREVFGEGS